MHENIMWNPNDSAIWDLAAIKSSMANGDKTDNIHRRVCKNFVTPKVSNNNKTKISKDLLIVIYFEYKLVDCVYLR